MMSEREQNPAPVLPLPRAPVSPEEAAEFLRGITDVLGSVIASLVGRGLLDTALMVDGLARHARTAREHGREFRAAPIEHFIQELPKWEEEVAAMMARTQAAPGRQQ
jgi:hypothetical protein